MSALSPIRVMVVGPDSLTRAGLLALISGSPAEFLLSGQADYNGRLPAEVELYEPDVIVWDVSESVEHLGVARDLAAPVVAIVPDDESASFAWKEGARAVLPRDVRPATLAAAIKAVNEGLGVFDIRVAEVPVLPNSPVRAPQVEALSEREMQVLQLVAEGLPNKSIAEQLGISEHTVKFHVNSILGKMGAQSRTQAVTLATRLGLIKL